MTLIRIVAAFGQEKAEEDNFTWFLEKNRQEGIKNHFKGIFGFALFGVVIYGAYAYGLSFGAILINKGYTNNQGDLLSLGDIISCFFGIIFGAFALGMGAPNMKAVSEARVNAASALSVINRKPKILINDLSAPAFNPNLKGSIEFWNVTYTYTSRKEPAVKNLNLVIEQGKTTAIVGASGSGKSTVAKLLERYYDPSEGEIKVFTQNLKDINLLSYRQKVGYVSQEPVLFNESIKENLLYCNPGASEEQIMIALNKANAKKIIEKLAEGIDTNVGSAGG